MRLELSPDDDELSVTVTLDRIADELGHQGILNEYAQDHEFLYLAAIALGTYEDEDYDIERTLMEFIRNDSELRVGADEADEIEQILRR